jgi:hypothetical protein
MAEDTGKKEAAPGWYHDPKLPNTMRYWSEDGWTEQRYELRPRVLSKPPPLGFGERPGGIMLGALLLAFGLGIIDGIVWLISERAGLIGFFAAVYFSSALFSIGLIAKGVELGIRAARHRPDLDY